MNPTERRQRILADLDRTGDGLIPRLSDKYGVSAMTIRRDLKTLEDGGQIVRTHGGAVRLTGMAKSEELSDWHRRLLCAQAQKEAIARYAAQKLVEDNDVIFLEGGTTVAMMAQFLAERERLTVVTNGLYTAEMLLRYLKPSTRILCAGGLLQRETGAFVGPLSNRFFGEFHAHRLFLSASGLTLAAGLTDPEILETAVKQAMIAAATEVIVLLDSSKFGAQSLMRVVEWTAVHHLITDAAAPRDVVKALRERGVRVEIVNGQ
jgi:DeoR/GlpR family transcriptional regulator of sugar metabolism